jgi:hypothetical protein
MDQSESIPLVLPHDSPPHSPVEGERKSIDELASEALSSPSSSPGSSPETQTTAIQMVPTHRKTKSKTTVIKRPSPDSEAKSSSPDSPPKSALLSRRVSEVQKKGVGVKTDIVITIQTKEEAKSPKRRMSERRRSSLLYPKHNVQSPLPHFLDEVAPYETDQVFGRSLIQSPLPSALRRPSIKPEYPRASLVGKTAVK